MANEPNEKQWNNNSRCTNQTSLCTSLKSKVNQSRQQQPIQNLERGRERKETSKFQRKIEDFRRVLKFSFQETILLSKFCPEKD